jgi:FixJ family two-component response regulator
VLLASGFSVEVEAQALLTEGAGGFLQKPFEKESLLRKISEVMKSQLESSIHEHPVERNI